MRKIVFLLALVLVGCGQNAGGGENQPTSAPAASAPTAVPAPSAAPTSAPATTTAPTSESASSVVPTPNAATQTLVDLAHKDLAGALGIAADQITTVNVEQMEWPNGSLGCPQPGMMYPQVITPGYKITLTAQGKQYNYHTNTRTQVVRCESSK